MNPVIKKKWAESLRSGDYKQGKQYLNYDGYCCLGVLCELAREEGVCERHYLAPQMYSYGDYQHYLYPPNSVLDWAGGIGKVKHNGEMWDLDVLNDKGLTFAELADLIEAQL